MEAKLISEVNAVVASSIKKNISEFIKLISSTYNINSDELLSLWKNGEKTPESVSSTESSSSTARTAQPSSSQSLPSNPDLEKLSKKELTDLCKAKGIKVSGTKQEIIARLSDHEKSPSIDKHMSNSSTSKGKAPETTPRNITRIQPTSKPAASSILSNIKASSGSHIVSKNKFGNYMHEQSGLVFKSAVDHKIIGRQGEDGSIIQLTSDDINTCNQYKFDYILPENLDSKIDLKNVNIDELDDASKSEDSDGEESGDDVEVEELIAEDDDDVEYEEYEEEVEYE